MCPETENRAPEVEKLYAQLKRFQESKGYFFNDAMDMTLALLESLLTNKTRLGYMACPCRLASGNYEADKDILGPCAYREPDVADSGACFCGLYGARAWLDGAIPRVAVPERRPPEKVLAGLGL